MEEPTVYFKPLPNGWWIFTSSFLYYMSEIQSEVRRRERLEKLISKIKLINLIFQAKWFIIYIYESCSG